MKTIPVTGEPGFAIVNDWWYPILSAHSWWLNTGYPVTKINGELVRMHHMVLPPVPGTETDHINGLKHDCREENLRNVTRAQNQQNRTSLNRNNNTGFKGVYFAKDGRKKPYGARCRGKQLGFFSTALEAAEAYNAELAKCGEFAALNNLSGSTGLPKLVSRNGVSADTIDDLLK